MKRQSDSSLSCQTLAQEYTGRSWDFKVASTLLQFCNDFNAFKLEIFHRWRACGFWHCSMTAGWKWDGMWVLTLHQMFFFSTRKKSQEYFFCFSFNLLPAVIFAAPHFLPVPLAIIFLCFLLFLIRVITCTICGLKWPKSRAMTTIRPLQWVFSFPEAYCQNFMLLQACSVFTATAKSYLHNATRYASNIFKTLKSL